MLIGGQTGPNIENMPTRIATRWTAPIPLGLSPALFWGLCWTLFCAAPSPASAAATSSAAADPAGRRTAALIRQLGDEQYPVRQQAQEALAKLGADAFDALVAAEDDDDLEVATRARYLVHLIRFDWISNSNSAKVKELLKDYDSQNAEARLQAMKELSELSGEVGLEPLCRLIRFEKSTTLSKKGALMVLGQRVPDESTWPQRARQIRNVISDSTRPAVRWLRAYLRFHDDPQGALAEWDKLVDEEMAAVSSEDPRAESGIQSLLLRHQVEMLVAVKQRPRALDVMRKLVARESGTVPELIEFVHWLVDRKAWEVIDELAKRFDHTFSTDRKLLYTWAQARKAEGKEDLAERYAEQAFHLPIGGDELQERLSLAYELRVHGMIAWSERELRHVLAVGPAESQYVLGGRFFLAEMLHEMERDADAAEVMRTLVNQIKRNQGGLAQALSNLQHPPQSVRAKLFYFEACALGAKKDFAKQAEKLNAAAAANPFDPDPDVLIGLFQLPNQTNERRAQTSKLIHDAAELYQKKIDDSTQNQPEGSYEDFNEYAWLIGNTEGNMDRAVEYSRKAVELGPQPWDGPGKARDHAGLLDTLGHCYAGKKDWENAVRVQTLAVQYDPYSLIIRHALDDFRKAQQAAKPGKTEKAGNPGK